DLALNATGNRNVSDESLKIAVFIDFDNIEIGVKSTLGREFEVGAVLDALKERGEVITKVAYGDWKKAGDYSRMLTQHAVRMVQRNMTPGGDKNGADINLALDALEMAFTHDHINAFVIVGGDSDFISLVEKLKQYDRKVFVVGGRQFTSAVMQRNCTEFIAYENVIRQSSRRQPSRERGSTPSPPAPLSIAPIGKAFPLVTRALGIMADREVTPQLGLLKSTLLQLDSTFSEKDYGVSSFRDFVEKLAHAGLVTLRHSGRSTLVDLRDGDRHDTAGTEGSESATSSESAPGAPDGFDGPAEQAESRPLATFADGVNLLRRVLQHPGAVSRWPMYVRNVKQLLKAADAGFDEKRHGNLVELLRVAQREGLVRLERDRQGVLRVFQGQHARAHAPEVGAAQSETIEAAGMETGAHDAVDQVVEPVAPVDIEASAAPGLPPADMAGPGPDAGAKPRRRRKAPAEAAPKTKSTAARKPRTRTTPTRKKKAQDDEQGKGPE
ncbi:MAG: NYN domain-containing protein, partial [Acidobacteriota bacterium]